MKELGTSLLSVIKQTVANQINTLGEARKKDYHIQNTSRMINFKSERWDKHT